MGTIIYLIIDYGNLFFFRNIDVPFSGIKFMVNLKI